MCDLLLKSIRILFIQIVVFSSLHGADKVELSGTYQVRIACGQDGHEERSYLVEPGPDKFSGKYHLLNLPVDLRKGLVTGKRIRLVGEKQSDQTKMLSKGQIRKDMYEYLKDGKGIPYESKDLSGILANLREDSVAEPPAAADGKAPGDAKHQHPPLRLKPMADDNQMAEVRILEHIVVSKLEIIP